MDTKLLSEFELERAVKGAGFRVQSVNDKWFISDPCDGDDGFKLEADSKREALLATFEHFELSRPRH